MMRGNYTKKKVEIRFLFGFLLTLSLPNVELSVSIQKMLKACEALGVLTKTIYCIFDLIILLNIIQM